MHLKNTWTNWYRQTNCFMQTNKVLYGNRIRDLLLQQHVHMICISMKDLYVSKLCLSLYNQHNSNNCRVIWLIKKNDVQIRYHIFFFYFSLFITTEIYCQNRDITCKSSKKERCWLPPQAVQRSDQTQSGSRRGMSFRRS